MHQPWFYTQPILMQIDAATKEEVLEIISIVPLLS